MKRDYFYYDRYTKKRRGLVLMFSLVMMVICCCAVIYTAMFAVTRYEVISRDVLTPAATLFAPTQQPQK